MAYNVNAYKKVGTSFLKVNLSTHYNLIEGKPTNYPPTAHPHTKSQITDFPSSMPASDVYSWAKQSVKPTYTAVEVGAVSTTGTAYNSTRWGNYQIRVGSFSSGAAGYITFSYT